MRKLKPEEKHLLKTILNIKSVGHFVVLNKSADNITFLNMDTGKELNIRY